MLTLTLVSGVTAPTRAAAATPTPDPVSVSLDAEEDGCHVLGAFHAPVSLSTAWRVLADYDSISRFVSSLRESRLEQSPDGKLLLRQDAVGSAFFIRRRVQVLLELEETPGRRIGFRDVLGKDFRAYAGEWRFLRDTTGVRIEYELRAEPTSALMRMFCRGSLLRGAQDLLGQVRVEMLRRQAAKGP